MILPSQPSSSSDGGDRDHALPPPYQEAVPPSQLLPSERPTTSPYAPSVSSRSDPPREPVPHPNSPPKEKEKESEYPPQQRTFDVFSSMVWGTASTSRSPDPASTSGHTVQSQDPLNPAPSAFARPIPKDYAYLPFQPMTMLSVSPNLADGFPMIPPPIISKDETEANPQHPFVSHDVTEEDWLKFLADLKAVASDPTQTRKSFLARVFLGELNEKEQRKRVVRFVNSWNHYFFQPRRMDVVLAHGRRIFNGVINHHPSHSTCHGRGRGVDPAHARGQRNRHRSPSTDSSSSDSSISSESSTSSESSISSDSSHSTAFESPETLAPPPDEPSSKRESGWAVSNDHQAAQDLKRGFGGPFPEKGECVGQGCEGCQDPTHHGLQDCGRDTAGPSTAPPVPDKDPGLDQKKHHTCRDQKLARKAEKRAWRAEKRGMKHERRRMKRAAKHERGQYKREMRHGGGRTRDQPWKLVISFHGVRRETKQ